MPSLETARLARQSYGIACAQNRFGGPRGIWLECTSCDESQVIVGSRYVDDPFANISTAEAAQVFTRHGWTGEGENLKRARCPRCAAS